MWPLQLSVVLCPSTTANSELPCDLTKPGDGREVYGGAGVSQYEFAIALYKNTFSWMGKEDSPSSSGATALRLLLPAFQILDELCILSGNLPPPERKLSVSLWHCSPWTGF